MSVDSCEMVSSQILHQRFTAHVHDVNTYCAKYNCNL